MTRQQFIDACEWFGIALLLVYVLSPLCAWWLTADPMAVLIVLGAAIAIILCVAMVGYFFGMSDKAFQTILTVCSAHALLMAALFGSLDRSFSITMAVLALLNAGVSLYWFVCYIDELRHPHEDESSTQQVDLAQQ